MTQLFSVQYLILKYLFVPYPSCVFSLVAPSKEMFSFCFLVRL